MNHRIQSIQIQIHKVDGSVEIFTQSEAGLADRILNEFQPARIFTREEIIIAGDNALISFPVHQVVRIDLVSEHLHHWILLPKGIVDAVELTESEFRTLLHNPELRDLWDQARAQETSMVNFLDLEMAGQKPLFLAMEVIIQAQAQPPVTTQSPLNVPTLCFRTRTGGIAALNLANLTRLAFFPGPQPVPAEAWPAHQANGSQPDRFAGNMRESVNGRQSLCCFPQNSRIRFTALRKNPNENESKMERKHQ
jgi:hypothetical protein